MHLTYKRVWLQQGMVGAVQLPELKPGTGVAGLMRAIVAEGLGFSAGAMGGLHLVLAGPSAAMASSSQVGGNFQALHNWLRLAELPNFMGHLSSLCFMLSSTISRQLSLS